MTKHTFTTAQSYEGQPATTHETTTDAETISDILDAFEFHLRGCGFHVNTGDIRYVKSEQKED